MLDIPNSQSPTDKSKRKIRSLPLIHNTPIYHFICRSSLLYPTLPYPTPKLSSPPLNFLAHPYSTPPLLYPTGPLHYPTPNKTHIVQLSKVVEGEVQPADSSRIDNEGSDGWNQVTQLVYRVVVVSNCSYDICVTFL